MNIDTFWSAGDLLALHYEQGGSPDDKMGRKLVLEFGRKIFNIPETQEIAVKYGISFDEVCMICESAFSLMPNPCLRWRKLIKGSNDANARMIASTILFLEPERFERIAIATSEHRSDEPMSAMQRVFTLVEVSKRELRSAAEDNIRQFGQPNFHLQSNGGIKLKESGCISLLLVFGVIFLLLKAAPFLMNNPS
jgi:hypothetical protein